MGLLRIAVPPGVVAPAPELVLPTVGVDAPPAAIVRAGAPRSRALSPRGGPLLRYLDSQVQISLPRTS